MTDKLAKIGDRFINVSNVTYIVDRVVHFNNGDTWTALEPEIKDLLAIMFDTPRPQEVTIVEEPIVIKKPIIRKKK